MNPQKVITELKDGLDKAHYWFKKETKEFKEIEKLLDIAKEYENKPFDKHIAWIKEHILKEGEKSTETQDHLNKLIESLLKAAKGVGEAFHTSDFEYYTQRIKYREEILNNMLKKDSTFRKFIENFNPTDQKQIKSLDHFVYELVSSITELKDIVEQFEHMINDKKNLLTKHEHGETFVAEDLTIAKKVTEIFNELFYNGKNYLDHYAVYHEIQRVKTQHNLQGSYLSHRIAQSKDSLIKLNSKELELADKVLKRDNREDTQEIYRIIKETKILPVVAESVFHFIGDLLFNLYLSRKQIHDLKQLNVIEGTIINTGFDEVPNKEKRILMLKTFFDSFSHTYQTINQMLMRYGDTSSDWFNLFIKLGASKDKLGHLVNSKLSDYLAFILSKRAENILK